jgi:hypothetical protein
MSIGGGQPKGTEPTVPFDVPAFASGGGITPDQQALGQYTYGQGLDAQGNLFGQSGTGQSTMATQGAEGARMAEAEQTGGMSDINQGARYTQYGNQVSNVEGQIQNQASLESLANTAAADQLTSGLGGLLNQNKSS